MKRLKYLSFIVISLLACGSNDAPIPTAEAQALVTSGSCNAFQPDHCGSCEDTLPFREALQVTVPWCSIGLCPPGREPWFCNPAFSATPIMCSVVGGNGPEALRVYCCDPVAANQICLSDADCGVMPAECYQSKCVNKACVVEPKPFNTPCSMGVCRFWEQGRPMACGQESL